MLVWLDGIDNAGAGQHSTTTTTWTDLSGNNNSPIIGGTIIWNSNNSYFDNAGYKKYVFPTSLGQFQTGSWTVEARIIRESSSTQDIIISEAYFSSGYEIFAIYFDPNNNKVIVYDGIYGWNDTKIYSTFEVTPGVITTITVTYTPGALKFYKDGVLANTINTTLTYTNNSPVPIGLGNYGSPTVTNSAPFGGNMYSIRIYNRVLTDSEVANNYAIDQARFQ